jgi:ribosome modulation factor
MKKVLLAGVAALSMLSSLSHAKMPHNRPCDIAQDHPGDLNPGGGRAIMFGLCGGIEDLPSDQDPSRHHTWNAFNCGYQAYRQGKIFGANPYYNDELEARWSDGWKEAEKACKTGKKPF